MAFIKGEAIVGFPFTLVNKETGAAITTGTVTLYLVQDGGDQTVAAATPVHKGNGQWTFDLNGNETNYDFIGITVVHADAIPQNFTIKTELPAATPAISVTVSSSGTSLSDTFEYYGTLTAADLYFDNRLKSSKWELSTVKDRERALITATRYIDKLNFAGDKADDDQNLQFPRGTDTEVPLEIEFACYEIALELLKGVDVELEARAVGVMAESYTGMRVNYGTDYVHEHVRAGIPSIEAWQYLKPFLRNPQLIKLSRVN